MRVKLEPAHQLSRNIAKALQDDYQGLLNVESTVAYLGHQSVGKLEVALVKP